MEALQAHTPAKLQVQMVRSKIVPGGPLDLTHQGTTDSGTAVLQRGLHTQHPGPVSSQQVRVPHQNQPAGQRLIDSCHQDAGEGRVQRSDQGNDGRSDLLCGNWQEREADRTSCVGYVSLAGEQLRLHDFVHHRRGSQPAQSQ